MLELYDAFGFQLVDEEDCPLSQTLHTARGSNHFSLLPCSPQAEHQEAIDASLVEPNTDAWDQEEGEEEQVEEDEEILPADVEKLVPQEPPRPVATPQAAALPKPTSSLDLPLHTASYEQIVSSESLCGAMTDLCLQDCGDCDHF